MKTVTALTAASLGMTLGCYLPFVNPTQHPDPEIAKMYDAPPIYPKWWARVESCAHKTKNMKPLRWYAVEPRFLEPFHDRRLPNDDDNIVYIRADRMLDSTVVIPAMVYRRFMRYKPFSGAPDWKLFDRIVACAEAPPPETGSSRSSDSPQTAGRNAAQRVPEAVALNGDRVTDAGQAAQWARVLSSTVA